MSRGVNPSDRFADDLPSEPRGPLCLVVVTSAATACDRLGDTDHQPDDE